MPQRAKLLYTLQRIDTQLARKTRRYQEVDASLGESDALQAARTAHEVAQEELARRRATLLNQELEVRRVAEKLKTDEGRLYSGQITNPRELGDLQQETEYLTRRKADMEDRQLEAMMAVDEATARAALASEEYAVVDAAWKAENAELGAEFETLKQELARLLAQRRAVVQHISADDMIEYDTVRRLRRGTAVVSVQEDRCTACNVQVPTRDLEGARQTDDLYHCSGCERILYVPEEK
jgi:predicted  nucleic acid-binding Zn-ribbon protein